MKAKNRSALKFRRAVSAVALGTMLASQNAAAWVIADTPPFLPTPMPPNVVVTLDDSGSMRWAYAPDGLCSTPSTRRAKSSDFNPLYYNPKIRYEAPPTANGVPRTTSFTAAWINGFDTSKGSRDLSDEYLATWVYNPSTSEGSTKFDPTCENWQANAFASNPRVDFVTTTQKEVQGDCAKWKRINGAWQCVRYDTETFTETTDNTRQGVAAYYYVYDPVTTRSKCTAPSTADDNCYVLKTVGSSSGPRIVDINGDGVVNSTDKDERQNFANWYSFYRTRNLLTMAAAAVSFQTMPKDARVAWQGLSTCKTFGTNCAGSDGRSVANHIRSWLVAPDGATDTSQRDNFYSWAARLPTTDGGGTPLRSAAMRAGQYFTKTGDNNPYKLNPNQNLTNQGVEYACRPNFHILMTDGIWNVDKDSDALCATNQANNTNPSVCNNRDNPTGNLTLPDGTVFKPTVAPNSSIDLTQLYRDLNSNSLADVAFSYWATDLRPDLANKLLPYYKDRDGTAETKFWNPQNDPATWQHLVTFTVGLGMTATLSQPGIEWYGSTFEGNGYNNLKNGTKSWPATDTGKSPGNVYDLWHAAINSRGMAFAAENPSELTSALRAALNRIMDNKTASAALAANSTRLADDSLIFQARFNTLDWSGALVASKIAADATRGAEVWDATAAGKIPAHGDRRIFTWDGTNDRKGIEFLRSPLEAAGLWTSDYTDDLLNYLRGDVSNDGKTVGTKTYRKRGTRLGDIVNSDPIFVGTQDYGYISLPEGDLGSTTRYDDFVSSKTARTKMLYVGANDGMLHAFNATSGADGGKEVFAYVPRAVVSKMPQLSNVDYAHKYFVDGSPSTWDAFFNRSWKTVVIGTTGAGAKAVFALDVTDPNSFDATKVLWEINSQTPRRTGDVADPGYAADLGYTLGQAVVAKLNNGEWAAVFGNGFGSTNEKAVLYVVRIADGSLIRKIDTGVGSATAPNGLDRPTLYDANGDDVYDYAYAADLQGNVWKFDLSGDGRTTSVQSSWKVAFDGAPLFKARNASGQVQPITGRIELARPPQGTPGVMVLFGTGQFFTTGDKTDNKIQSFYSVLDRLGATQPITATDRSTLRRMNISQTTASYKDTNGADKSITVRRVAPHSPTAPTLLQGWYMDLIETGETAAGERVIGSPVVRGGRVIFTTLIPNTDPCDFGGGGWLMEVDAKTGFQLDYSVFDTNRDGSITNASDLLAAGMKIDVGIVKQPLVLEGSPNAAKLMSGTSGEIQVERNRSFNQGLGRNSWRDIRK